MMMTIYRYRTGWPADRLAKTQDDGDNDND